MSVCKVAYRNQRILITVWNTVLALSLQLWTLKALLNIVSRKVTLLSSKPNRQEIKGEFINKCKT